MTVLPAEIKALPHWTGHVNKRPLIAPNCWAQGKTYNQIIAETNQYGLLVAPASETPYLFIDIDYPHDAATNGYPSKEEVMAKVAGITWGSEEHLSLLKPTLDSIRATSLYPLLTQTYTEFSPSGTGLRLIIQSQDKKKFQKAYKKAKVFSGQIDFRDQFITITERIFPGAPSTVLEVPLLQLADAFGFQEQKKTSPAPELTALISNGKTAEAKHEHRHEHEHEHKYEHEHEYEIESGNIPKLQTILRALQTIPINQSKRIKHLWSELTNKEYEHYDFWLSIGMALHEYSTYITTPSKVYLAFLQWSAQDEAGYTGEDDVDAKWKSFGQTPNESNITWRTLLKLASKCEFNYPRPIISSKGINTGRPIINEWANFDYLLQFYDIKLHEDDAFYVSGDPDICQQYFLAHGAECLFDRYYGPLSVQDLVAGTTRLCQDSRWRGLTTTATLVNTWITRPREDIDLVKTWLDTPFDQLPESLRYSVTTRGRELMSKYDDQSTLDYVFRALNVQYSQTDDINMAKEMVKKTLMQFIKFREDIDLPFTDNGGMLILIGAENTYKSTFFKLLLPRALDRMRKVINMQVQSEKTVRDFIRYLGTKAIIQIDEFEGLMDHAKQGGLFKNIISSDSASFVDIYQTAEKRRARKAIIVGTSNETKQVLSDNGSRRMWFVKVNKIDTEAMLYINLHTLYNNLRKEFQQEYKSGTIPWLLNQEAINQLYTMNDSMTAKSDLAIWLEELWPTHEMMQDDYRYNISSIQTDKSGKLYTTRDVLRVLEFRGAPTRSIKMSALERALERHCGKWTGTLYKEVHLHRPVGILYKGRMMQGELPNGKFKYTKWLMPPLVDEGNLEK